ncbi:MAG: ATP-binding cassette domain-containing protein, partial [Gemmatimonadales bacterium]
MHEYAERTVLDIPTLTFEPGTVTALVGSNGSGKSTLLRLAAFLEQPSAGSVLLHGEAVSGNAIKHARRRVTLVEQHPLLFGGSVTNNMRYAAKLNAKDIGTGEIDAVLARLGIQELAVRHARELSKGEAQKVAIARALLLRPEVLIMDEPTSAMDRAGTHDLHTAITDETG